MTVRSACGRAAWHVLTVVGMIVLGVGVPAYVSGPAPRMFRDAMEEYRAKGLFKSGFRTAQSVVYLGALFGAMTRPAADTLTGVLHRLHWIGGFALACMFFPLVWLTIQMVIAELLSFHAELFIFTFMMTPVGMMVIAELVLSSLAAGVMGVLLRHWFDVVVRKVWDGKERHEHTA